MSQADQTDTPETDTDLEDYPMKLEVGLGDKLIPLVTTSRSTADFEEDHEIKIWLVDNDINYEILILEDSNEIDLRFLDENGNESKEIETYFTLRWIDANK